MNKQVKWIYFISDRHHTNKKHYRSMSKWIDMIQIITTRIRSVKKACLIDRYKMYTNPKRFHLYMKITCLIRVAFEIVRTNPCDLYRNNQSNPTRNKIQERL